jgi:hypothetical protein
MTLPYEEYNSLNSARRFLYDLLDPKKTPRVPKYIRKEAHRITKHFPLEVILQERYNDVIKQEQTQKCPTKCPTQKPKN